MDCIELIQIAGLGVSGAYLLNRLSSEGIECEGYDPRPDGFPVPCGYALNSRLFFRFCELASLDSEKYIQVVADDVIFTNSAGKSVHFSPAGLATIDKDAFLADLVEGKKRHHSQLKKTDSSITIDATGVSRSILGPVEQDFTMRTIEYISDPTGDSGFRFRFFPSGSGYHWIFPLKSFSHVGAGSDDLDTIRESLEGTPHSRVLSRNIRLKPLFDNISSGNVIGVGESIGTVSPITGEGIVPSLECAEILFQILRENDDLDTILEKYSEQLRQSYSRYLRLFDLLMNVRNSRLLSLRNFGALSPAREDLRYFGIEASITKIIAALL